VLAQNDVVLAPFTGAAVEFEPASGKQRAQVFGYAFVDDFQSIAAEIFGGLEVFDTSSGRANPAAAPIAMG